MPAYTPQYGALYIGGAAPPSGAAWDATSATAGITIGGTGNRLVTCSGGGGSTQARSTTGKTSGQWFARFQFINDAAGANTGIALVSSAFPLGSVYMGGDSLTNLSVCAYRPGQTYKGNGTTDQWYTLPPTCTTGSFVELAMDLDVSPARAWWQLIGTQSWMNGFGDPTTNTAGIDISEMLAAGSVHFAVDFESGETGSAWNIVTGTPPSGFTSWT